MCIKIPETVRGLYKINGRAVPRVVKSNPDFVLGIDGLFVLFDAKVTNDRLWNLKKYALNEEKIHQFHALLLASQYGNVSGYMVWFRTYSVITWIPIEVIQRGYENKLASITPETDGVISQKDDELIRFRELFGVKYVVARGEVIK